MKLASFGQIWCFLPILCSFHRKVCSATRHPIAENPLLGEQKDLLGNESAVDSKWTKSTPYSAAGDTISTADSVDSIFPTHQLPIGRNRETLEDVEQIEPRQWPDVPRVFPTRSTFPPTPGIFFGRRPTLAQRNPSSQRRPAASSPPATAPVDEVFCDFGSLPAQSLCEWQSANGALDWMAGTGLGTNWMGGPPSDSTSTSMEGGYAFAETSQLPTKEVKFRSPGALLHSPQLGSTGVTGTCVLFKYTIEGLSVAGLRVLLHVGVDEYSFKKEQEEETPVQNVTVQICDSSEVTEERPLWHAQYYAQGLWQQAQILYTYAELHSLIIEGIPVDASDPFRLYRGYIAIDDIELQPGASCMGFCNFAAGFCDWNNDAEDDFDWTISRGSGNPATGPAIDSSSERGYPGGYAYIDSNFPRTSGDTAKLVSSTFPPTSADSPTCIHFWFHMFGSGIGTLKLFLRHIRNLDAQLREIWGLAGNAGNAWFMSQATISSLDDYQLIFEASVGNTGMGDIAIDDISFSPGTCPGILRVSVQPETENPVEPKPIWQLYNNQGPAWNYARATIKEKRDFSVIFEGTWGPNRASGSIAIDDIAFYTGNCAVRPASAAVRSEDCSFEKGLCGWENMTSSDNDHGVTWQRAFLAHRPAQLLDKTFGATGDFVFFDIFTTNKKSIEVQLRSPIIRASMDEESVCFTFWFAAFGVEESTMLEIVQTIIAEEENENNGEVDDEMKSTLWSLTAKGFNNPRPAWTAAQVTVDARMTYRLILKGSASNGGFAIDDIKFLPHTCSIRPAAAQPINPEM
ncbi:hypothetical protein KM043_014527 [Ampulex compressa]|nr:hypothetical protein KM043_014527 [Ampulex compressa]